MFDTLEVRVEGGSYEIVGKVDGVTNGSMPFSD